MNKAVINLPEKLSKFSDHWAPRVVAELNDYQVQTIGGRVEKNLPQPFA